MDVTKLPFNEFIGLKRSNRGDYLLMLDDRAEYANHLYTVHASAQFALAEATSGEFLLSEFAELTDIVPVVRKVETKYRKPAVGKVYSKAKFIETQKDEFIETLTSRGRALLKVEVSLYNADSVMVMQSTFEWFVNKIQN